MIFDCHPLQKSPLQPWRPRCWQAHRWPLQDLDGAKAMLPVPSPVSELRATAIEATLEGSMRRGRDPQLEQHPTQSSIANHCSRSRRNLAGHTDSMPRTQSPSTEQIRPSQLVRCWDTLGVPFETLHLGRNVIVNVSLKTQVDVGKSE
eukprot:640193-Amphidinium_carterae.1